MSNQISSMARSPCFLGVVILISLGSLLFIYDLGDRELSSSHEARAGQNAAVILESGHWGLPRLFDEQVELQKPPLYYWLVALAAWLRGGVDAWAVRLPAALSALACVLLIFRLLSRNGRAVAGFIAAAILASSWHFTWLARVGRIDMPLTLAVTAALGCLYLGERSWRWRIAAHAAIAIGVLLKGPIAVALVAAVAVAMHLIEVDGFRPRTFLRNAAKRLATWWWGAGMVALVAGPWFVWANLQTGGRLWDVFFVYHNFERGFGSETLAAHPCWFYAARFWIDALPWSIVTPAALWLVWKRKWWREDAICRFGLAWFLSIAALLSLMRFKRADYLLPASPGLALFLGAVAERWWAEARPRWAPAALATTLLSYAACWVGFLHLHDDAWPYRTAAQKMRKLAGHDTPIIFFRAEVHPLAFHLRRPLGSILEWENLEIWANEPRPVYFVMPAECARISAHHLRNGCLTAVFPLGELLDAKHDRDLIVLRNEAAGEAGRRVALRR
jgi:4-amino-4-deoxy-L-arabinose transferase-like glycosyltransferase